MSDKSTKTSIPVKMRIDEKALAKIQEAKIWRSSSAAKQIYNWGTDRVNAYFDARAHHMNQIAEEILTPEEYRVAWAHRSEFDVYNPEVTEISEETAEERKNRLKNLTPEQKEEREKAKQLYGKVSEEFTKRHKQTVEEFATKHSGEETEKNAMKWFRDWWFNELNRQVEERLGESRYVRFFPDDTPETVTQKREKLVQVRRAEHEIMCSDLLMTGPYPNAIIIDAWFTILSKTAGSPFDWWKTENDPGVSRPVVSGTLRNLSGAYNRYFSNLKKGIPMGGGKKRKDGRRAGWPAKKKRHETVGFAIQNLSVLPPVKKDKPPTPQETIDKIRWKTYVSGSRVRIPGFGSIRVHGKKGETLCALLKKGAIPKSARFTYSAGSWWVTILSEIDRQHVERSSSTRRQRKNGPVGVDLGVVLVGATSAGEVFKNPRISEQYKARKRRTERLLDHYKKHYKETEGRDTPVPSRAVRNARKRLNKIRGQEALARETFNHTMTKHLIMNHELVVIEDLKLSNMLKRAEPKEDPDKKDHFLPNGGAAKSGLSRSLSEVAPYQIRTQLEYKAARYGSTLVTVDPRNTSRTCHECGHVDKLNRNTQNDFVCVNCGHADNADVNAARNILKRGLQG